MIELHLGAFTLARSSAKQREAARSEGWQFSRVVGHSRHLLKINQTLINNFM